MTVRPTSLILLLTLGVMASASAQDGKTYNYSTSTGAGKQSAQEVEDIGEIEESKEAFQSFRDKLRFNVQARAAYTTNAKLDGSHGSSDALFMPTVEAGFHTPLGKHFSFDLSTKLESVLYAKYDERSFVGYSAMATLDYRIKKGLPRFYASIEPYRYDSFDTGDLKTQAIGFTGKGKEVVPVEEDVGAELLQFGGGIAKVAGLVGSDFTEMVRRLDCLFFQSGDLRRGSLGEVAGFFACCDPEVIGGLGNGCSALAETGFRIVFLRIGKWIVHEFGRLS